jgi:hypothetical protein
MYENYMYAKSSTKHSVEIKDKKVEKIRIFGGNG